MSRRLVLIVGSQCDLMGYELSMLPSAAHDLAAVLTSDLGRCTAALPSGPVLIDPTATELDNALVAALREAHEQHATLVVAFVGHGGIEDGDFYLMAKDSSVADSRHAVLIGQRVKELVRRYSALDGLIMLIDACHSGLAVDAAGREWFEPVRRSRRRLGLLTSTDENAAYGACATRTLTRTILTGSPQLGERLHFAELKSLLDERCASQVAIHLAFDGSREVALSDPASWIAFNAAWRSSPLATGTGPAVVEQLTRFYEPTIGYLELRRLLDDGSQCVVVTGPQGSGKSAAVAELTHPRTAVEVHAAVFLTGSDTVEQVATEIARQLRASSIGFAEACDRYWDSGLPASWPRVDAMEVHVVGPLAQLDQPVRIVIDGIDTHDAATAATLVSTLERLTALPHVQLVVTGERADAALTSAQRVELGAASPDELARYAARRDSDGLDEDALAREFAAAWKREPWRGYGTGSPQVFGLLHAGVPWRDAAQAFLQGQGSQGNGAAMRVAPVALVGTNPRHTKQLAHRSAAVTHAHPHGRHGAECQAVAAHLALHSDPARPLDETRFLQDLREVLPSQLWREKLDRVGDLHRHADPARAAQSLGNDTSAIGSVPLALLAFLRNPDDPADAIRYAVRAGGATDTIAGMAGALTGAAALPQSWLRRFHTARRLCRLADQLARPAATELINT